MSEITAATTIALKRIAEREQEVLAAEIKKLAEAWNGSRVGTRTTTKT